MNKIERLMAKVSMPAGCWLWTGTMGAGGYGRLRSGRRGDSRTELAHRVMWEAVHGPIPPGGDVLHHCDTPACVRPDHLYLGNDADNARDRTERERGRKILTAREVVAIRAAYATGDWTMQALGRIYGVAVPTIHNVVHRVTWKHVP
jgi:hypothetical protein